jgi:glycosyltransferase involved in cell wall biosynthesis
MAVASRAAAAPYRAACVRSAATWWRYRTSSRGLRRDLWLRASRVSTIPNGVRYVAATHSTLRHELNLAPEDRLVVAVGNLYPVKGHRFAVEALALLRERHPRLHLAIAGRGDLAEALRQQAEERGVAARLHLLGLRADISNVLAGADAFVLPSLSEGLPLALLEAMFSGCPIVASDVGEVRAVLGDGTAGARAGRRRRRTPRERSPACSRHRSMPGAGGSRQTPGDLRLWNREHGRPVCGALR